MKKADYKEKETMVNIEELERAMNLFKKAAEVKFVQHKTIASKKYEREAIDILEKIRSKGLLVMPDNHPLVMTGMNYDQNHLWLNIPSLDEQGNFIKVNGPMSPITYIPGDQVKIPFHINGFCLRLNDGNPFLDIGVDFALNKAEKTEGEPADENGAEVYDSEN